MSDGFSTSEAKSPSHNVERDMLATFGPPGLAHKFLVIGLAMVVAWALVAYLHQLRIGLSATAMSDYFSWGVYIVNFVFFIGISMAGSLISAMLRLSNAHWRHPISRLAEAITVFSLLVAGPMVIIDMGRPDRFLHVLRYGRLQSPILWDVLSLTSYLAGSFLYLYVPMIPDLAILRDAPGLSRWRKKLYRTLAMRWTGTADQHRQLDRAVSVMAIVILPVAVSIHTVTAWLFGMTLRPGWHSTIIGPDFVIGALYSGVAAVITAIVLFRYFLRLQSLIPVDHLRKLARLMLVFGLAYAYFVINEHVGAAYTGEGAERPLLEKMITGHYAIQFWAMIFIGLVLPVLMLVTPMGRTIAGIAVAAIFVNVGMWLKRYIIVVPTLASPFMPAREGAHLVYVPTWVEWSITAGGFAAFLLMFILFSKVFPIVSIWEVDQTQWPRPVETLADPGAAAGVLA
ncbi:MAG: NrfD/PsrC family molybdoenzyme membrane anchor subunit [Tepidisphaeraceae bacterium]|jgi:molybdopterin-containing oxidoreductase family membrane subunit